MPRFRKKPVEIEAVRFTGLDLDGKPAFVGDRPAWLIEALEKGEAAIASEAVYHGAVYPFGDHLQIETLEGGHTASPGDWIIQGVAGEICPCKPAIFAATYDEVAQ